MYPKSTEDIKKYLSLKGVSPSVIRVNVYKYLVQRRNHPTADIIYNELKKDIFTLSKASIYNTLNTFVDNNVIAEVLTEGNELRYDADIITHGHFKCVRCSSIHDIDIYNIDFSSLDESEYAIYEKHLIMKGLCPECKKNI